MSLNVNRVIIAGNLTRDPELRTVAADKVVVHFSLAINHKYKGNDGQLKEDVTFVDCEAWGRTAELIGQYLAKGSAAFCEGRLKLDSWQDKDGKNRQRLKVVVDSVQFVGPPKAKDGNTEPRQRVAPGSRPGSADPVEAGQMQPTGGDEPAYRLGPAPQPKPAGQMAVGHDEPPF